METVAVFYFLLACSQIGCLWVCSSGGFASVAFECTKILQRSAEEKETAEKGVHKDLS